MNNRFHTKVAILSLILFSRTIFALDVKTAPGLINPKPIGPANPSRDPNPIFTTPGKIPGKFNPPTKTPIDLHPVFEDSKKLPGTFGTPADELSKGNVANAKTSCLQEAIQSGDQIPIDESSIYSFANQGLHSFTGISADPANSISNLTSSGNTPSAFAGSGSCDESAEHQSCVDLFTKSTKEVPQAYYNSEINDNQALWEEVETFLGFDQSVVKDGHKDINQVLEEAQSKVDSATGVIDAATSNLLQTANGMDPLLTATNLVIQKIDQSLALGDLEGANRGQQLLQKLNPSAAYSLQCLGVYQPSKTVDDPLAGHKGTGIGPISGVDYTKLKQVSEHGVTTTELIAAVGVGFAALTWWETRTHNREEEAQAKVAAQQASAADKRAAQAALDSRIKDYLGCTVSFCDALYPDAAKAVADAKAASEKTSTASSPDQTKTPTETAPTPDDGFSKGQTGLDDRLPVDGTGGNGGELVSPDIAKLGPLPSQKPQTKARDIKRVDPEAAQDFCRQVVISYKHFKSNEIESQGRVSENQTATSNALPPIVPMGIGIAKFDDWTPTFWLDKAREAAASMTSKSDQNNCYSMDKVQGQ